MSKKDYVAIADAIRRCRADYPRLTVDDVCYAIAQVMRDDNPRFDRDRFLATCGVSDAIFRVKANAK